MADGPHTEGPHTGGLYAGTFVHAGKPVPESSSEWERHARWWQVNFTEGADLEYSELIIPMLLEHLEGLGRPGDAGSPGGIDANRVPMVLDVGTGEGQVSRAVATRFGLPVLGCDASWGQLTEARRRGGGPVYLRGLATGLPVKDSSIDAAIVCLLLEHVADLESALAELARVLCPAGRLLVVLNHPIVATPGSGWIDDHTMDPPEQYWQLGPYLTEGVSVEPVAKGVHITFHHRTLSRYLNTARSLGLSLQHMAEPAPPPGFVALAPQYTEQMTMPRMMMLRFERL